MSCPVSDGVTIWVGGEQIFHQAEAGKNLSEAVVLKCGMSRKRAGRQQFSKVFVVLVKFSGQ